MHRKRKIWISTVGVAINKIGILIVSLLLVGISIFGILIYVQNPSATGSFYNVSPAIAIDSKGDAHIVWQTEDYEDNGYVQQLHEKNGNDGIYYKKISSVGKVIVDVKRLADAEVVDWSGPEIIIDSKDNAHIVWVDDKTQKIEVYYMKLDNNGNVLLDSTKVSQVTKLYSYSPLVFVDSNDDIHILWKAKVPSWPEEISLYYAKLDKLGKVIKHVEITSLSEDYKINAAIDTEGDIHISINYGQQYLVLNKNGQIYDKTGKITLISDIPIVLDEEGHISSFYDSAVADHNNIIHIVYDCGSHLNYTKMDIDGTKIIENKTLITFSRKSEQVYSPVIFCVKSIVDHQNNIHIVWYINDGSNHFEIYYMKIDNNGETLISSMRVDVSSLQYVSIVTSIIVLIIILIILIIFYEKPIRKTNSN